ncbi:MULTISPECIES: hypothetical protein [unclassified Streptomyces]|uniref:hypothetical protein n=1 Tax=unclassified Streptomyces TaxID=2593676 RepID=UPI000934B4CF|nr:hypothetical protein [Streptomyces sp. NBRC 110465]
MTALTVVAVNAVCGRGRGDRLRRLRTARRIRVVFLLTGALIVTASTVLRYTGQRPTGAAAA